MPKRTEPKTQKQLDKIAAPASGKRQIAVSPGGLYLVIYSAGTRSWKFESTLQAGPRMGEKVAFIFADAKGPGLGGLDIEAARARAYQYRDQVRNGIDPREEKKKQAAERKTFEQVWSEYKETPRFKERKSAEAVVMKLEGQVLPKLGKRPFSAITYDEIKRLHDELSKVGEQQTKFGKVKKVGGPIAANRAVAELSTVFSEMGRRNDNPCRGVKRYREKSRKLRLNRRQVQDLLAALDGLNDKQAADIIRIQLFTGTRRGEVIGMRWEEVDFEERFWVLPSERTKQGEEHEVFLNSLAFPVIERLKAEAGDSPFVFPSPKLSTGARTYPYEAWNAVKKAAGLPADLHPHDLRHTFVSAVRDAGHTLDDAADLVGHASKTMTEIYDTPDRDRLRKVSEATADWLKG